MSDIEQPQQQQVEQEQVKRARPQSVIAQNFSLALDSVFGLDGSFERTQEIEDKKMVVNTQSKELEALEARLRATEERLKAKTGGKSSDTSSEENHHQPSSTRENKQPNGAIVTPTSRPGTAQIPGSSSYAQRPGTANRAQMQARNNKPPPPQAVEPEDSDEEEDSEEEDEDTEETSEEEEEEEASEEEEHKRRK